MCARARERKSKCVCVCVCVLVLREMGDVRFFEVRPFNLFPLPFNLSILQSLPFPSPFASGAVSTTVRTAMRIIRRKRAIPTAIGNNGKMVLSLC